MRESDNPWCDYERRSWLLRQEKSALDREREWQAECAERRLRADLAWDRFKAAFMRGDFAPRRKAGFNPNQPRVAAGNPDGGQWTDGNGAQGWSGDRHDRATGRNDPRVLSDATPDNFFKPGAQLAQDDSARRSPVDLRGMSATDADPATLPWPPAPFQ